MDSSLEINLDFYRLLFANVKLRNTEFNLLYKLYQKLKEEKFNVNIPEEQIEQIK